MNITFKRCTLELTYDELWNFYYYAELALIRSVESHWINYPDRYPSEESKRLDQLKLMASVLGRLDMFEYTQSKIEEIFKNNKSNEKSSN